jgi:hypothetical protein
MSYPDIIEIITKTSIKTYHLPDKTQLLEVSKSSPQIIATTELFN